MSKYSSPTYVPWTALIFSLLGLVWCGYIAFPTSIGPICETSGCALIQDGKVGKVSLWWIGGAYFFLQAVLCLRGARIAAWMLARFALFLDCLLLLAMFFTGPCINCLVVAVFFALVCFFLRPSAGGWFVEAAPSSSILLPVWFGLFLGNSLLAANEAIPQMTIGKTHNAETRIYFAPSCSFCREALVAFGDNAVLYPVKEQESDTDAVLRLRALLEANAPMEEAISRSLSRQEPVPDISTADRLLFELQMLRNKAVILRQGITSLPLIMVNGMPKRSGGDDLQSPSGVGSDGFGGMSRRHNDQGFSPSETPPDLLPDFLRDASELNSCGGGNVEPCPD